MSSTTSIDLVLIGDQARALAAALATTHATAIDVEKLANILPPLPTPPPKKAESEEEEESGEEEEDEEDEEESDEEEPVIVIPPLEVPVLKEFLFELVFAQNIFAGDASEKEIESIFASIVALAKHLEPAHYNEIISGLSKLTISSQTEKVLLRIKILNNLYNIHPHNSAARFESLTTLLTYVRNTKNQDIVLGSLERIESIVLSTSSVSPVQIREVLQLVRSIYDSKKKTLASYETSIKILSTYSQQDVAESVADATTTSVIALQTPEIFQFDRLLAIPAIAQLETKDAALYKCLKVFASETTEEFKAFSAENPDFFTKHGISAEDALTKIKLLTLCSLAEKANIEGNSDLTFESVANALKLESTGDELDYDVEYWIVSTISAGLIEAKINQFTRTISITRTIHRVFESVQWAALTTRLSAWRTNIATLTKIVQTNAAALKDTTTANASHSISKQLHQNAQFSQHYQQQSRNYKSRNINTSNQRSGGASQQRRNQQESTA